MRWKQLGWKEQTINVSCPLSLESNYLKNGTGCKQPRCVHVTNFILINPLKPNDTYRSRTAPITSKRFILYIYSTNIGTEYFKHGI
jgi:hypothetical protein